MRARGTGGSVRSGFTLIELLIAVIVIGALMGLLIVGLRQAAKFARKSAQQQTVSGLKSATTNFKTEFGFLPPLVYDGEDMGRDSGDVQVESFSNSGPVYVDAQGRSLINVYQLGNDRARAFLRGEFLDNSAPDYKDPRYSKFSLPFYLAGALDGEVDGVTGPGMSEPLADGAWAGVGDALGGANRTYEPLVETGKRSLRLEREYFDRAEADALGGGEPGSKTNRLALVDGKGKAYRYYRWLHDEDPSDTLGLNIPGVLLDPVLHRDAIDDPTIDVTGGDMALRSAGWAIVGAGQNGVFGDELIAELKSRLDVPGNMDEALVRREAASDNVVEVGE
jgi:prepilin-type N-terminal cleavage/methylation domain-containing protein